MSRALEVIDKWWKAEAPRHFLWVPVGFAGGVALYFSLSIEPALWLLWVIATCALSLTIGFRKKAYVPCLTLLLITLGAAWAATSAHSKSAIRLQEALDPRSVKGVVSYIERTEHGVRITLKQVTIKGFPTEKTPESVRLSVRLKPDSELELPHIGEAINITAGLRPPMGPVLPHGFDFARFFYFREIGAVGYGLPPWRIRSHQPEKTLSDHFWDWRIRITEDILDTVGKETGGIAAGLITGDARAISEEDFKALRASNLYHIIAISGEHMVIIAGVIFVGLRLLALLLLPARYAYRPQVKTAAAVMSLVLVTAYLFVTGLPISAVRAYVMIVLVLLAVVFHRQVDAMRSLSITALIMLVWDPANLFDPGFQLSFAATLAIIALVETTLLNTPETLDETWPQKLWRIGKAMLLVSVVAEAATMPLVIAMFNNFSPYGVFANMLATTLVSLFLMPTVALYFILLPFGLHHAALWLMNLGIKALLGIAYWVSSLPHAQLFLPSIPGYGVAIIVLGLLWCCLWRTRTRRYGIIAILIGFSTITLNRAPDMLVGAELKQVAFKTEYGHVLARGRRNSMVPNLWANGLGYDELPKAPDAVWQCEERNKNCIAIVGSYVIGFPEDAQSLQVYCAKAELIFSKTDGETCENGVQIIGKTKRASGGVTALWFRKNGNIHLENSQKWQGNRPWGNVNMDENEE